MDKLTAILKAEGEIECSEEQFIEAWQYLIDSGIVWTLQGYFGRTARSLIDGGFCTKAK